MTSPDISLRVPPHSLEAEQAVLGSLLIDHQAYDQVLEIVQAADFYSPDNRLIFAAMGLLSEAARPIDVVTVSEALDANGELEQVGGIAHLAELARQTPGTSNILTYAKIVRERAVLRQLIRTAHNVADTGYSTEGRSSDELLAEAENLFANLADQRPAESGIEAIEIGRAHV